MENDSLNLGKKLQMFRSQRELTIKQLSSLTGMTSSMLSQIEHQQVNPSINSLRTIAEALGVPLYRFFRRTTYGKPMVTKSSRKTIGRPEEGDVIYELFTPDTSGTIEFCMMIVPP